MVDWEVAGYAWDLLPKAVRDLVCRRHGFELENACSECAYKASLLEQGRYDGREHPAGDLLEGRTIGCRRRVGASGWLASTAAASHFPRLGAPGNWPVPPPKRGVKRSAQGEIVDGSRPGSNLEASDELFAADNTPGLPKTWMFDRPNQGADNLSKAVAEMNIQGQMVPELLLGYRQLLELWAATGDLYATDRATGTNYFPEKYLELGHMLMQLTRIEALPANIKNDTMVRHYGASKILGNDHDALGQVVLKATMKIPPQSSQI